MKPSWRASPVTVLLIAASVGLTLLTGFGNGEHRAAMAPFLISRPGTSGLSDIMRGQVWRLVTPIFLHFSLLHLLFNVLWVADLGRLIEAVRGSRFYIVLVLVLAITSNLLQFFLGRSLVFGGLSGVIYGFLSYCYVMQQLAPRFELTLQRNTVVMMLVWYVLCWTGILGAIANWAHTGGLLMGCCIALIDAGLKRRQPIRPSQR